MESNPEAEGHCGGARSSLPVAESCGIAGPDPACWLWSSVLSLAMRASSRATCWFWGHVLGWTQCTRTGHRVTLYAILIQPAVGEGGSLQVQKLGGRGKEGAVSTLIGIYSRTMAINAATTLPPPACQESISSHIMHTPIFLIWFWWEGCWLFMIKYS